MTGGKNRFGKYLEEGLLALVPVYGQEGSASHVYTCRGDYKDSHTVNWLLSGIASYYGTSMKLLKEVYAPLLNRANTIPLPLSREMVLLPFKMREPRIAGDTSLGYVNGLRISRVEPAPEPFRSSLHFQEGLVLKSYTSPATVWERVHQGNSIHREFLRRLHVQGPSSLQEGAGRKKTDEEFFVQTLEGLLKGLDGFRALR